MASRPDPDLSRFLATLSQSLEAKDLPFMLIGGLAVLLHGQPRLTEDIDVALGVEPDRLNTVLEVCEELELDPLPREVEPFVRETFVLPALHGETRIRVDFVFSTTPYERQAIDRAVRVEVGGVEVPFATAEDLILHKLFAGRPREPGGCPWRCPAPWWCAGLGISRPVGSGVRRCSGARTHGRGSRSPSGRSMIDKHALMLGALALFGLAIPARAQDESAPYAGLETREIKALSIEEVEGLLSGEGMGYALPAELNHYPGPRHVLALADSLGLTPSQRAEVETIEARMRERAIALGRRIVDAEAGLDSLFATGGIDRATLERKTAEIARLEGELRAAHLSAHIETREVLTDQQIAAYDRLRGYGSGHGGEAHRHQ